MLNCAHLVLSGLNAKHAVPHKCIILLVLNVLLVKYSMYDVTLDAKDNEILTVNFVTGKRVGYKKC